MQGVIFVLSFIALAYSAPTNKLITKLPGLSFQYTAKQYSGYLNASTKDYEHYLHYWFLESQSKPSTDPLVVWFNGGPGCSSLGGLLTELGPFRPTPDGSELWENVYSWNKAANVIFLESPTGVGFSYSTDWQDNTNDNKTATDNYHALINFFEKFPEFKNSDFYITGESFAGVYIPTLTALVVDGVKSGEFPGSLKGIAIGNGILSEKQQTNSLIEYLYRHGFIGVDQYNEVKQTCCGATDCTCDYYAKMHAAPDGECGVKVYALVELLLDDMADPYNVYQDCYDDSGNGQFSPLAAAVLRGLPMPWRMGDNNDAINYGSTDALRGFPCWGSASPYLNREDVKDALHITDPLVRGKKWSDCNMTVNANYVNTYPEMDWFFKHIIDNSNIRILIYNGDVDTVCNFLGDEWFIDGVVHDNNLAVTNDRKDWLYMGQIAGYVKKFDRIDVLTVKGSGHFVPMDRAGPSLQMLMNFMENSGNYSKPSTIDVTPQLLADPDEIINLPGLPEVPKFRQFSGYLDASSGTKTHKIFYWLVESQRDPINDPLLLWMNGGPGCSSLGGFFEELGPFHPNIDGETLYENVDSWNKYANVLFIEAPTGVGFSYSTDWQDVTNDDDTADDNYRALKDFFKNKHPRFQNSSFFISGESYAGVYVPTLSKRVVDGMNSGDLPVNFMGMAIGNGVLSEHLQHNSVIQFMYYHGLIGSGQYLELNQACCNQSSDCNCDWFTNIVKLNSAWDDYGSTGSLCSNMTLDISSRMLWSTLNDEYNIYQDCYSSVSTHKSNLHSAMKTALPNFFQQNYVGQITYESTDQLNGFPCWNDNMLQKYLNKPEVQKAIHVDEFIINSGKMWQDCNDTVNESYKRKYFDMDDQFKHILDNSKARIMIYNGDVDMVCNFLGDEWFSERVAKNNSLSIVKQRQAWRYRGVKGGFVKQFDRMDVVTVKGAGHFVPSSRAGPSLQMITNFMFNTNNYSLPISHFDPTPPATTTSPTPSSGFAPPTMILPAFWFIIMVANWTTG